MTKRQKRVERHAVTLRMLDRFVRVRNKSDFTSNLQFQCDASDCGFSVNDLGPVRTFTIDGIKGYEWSPTTDDGGGLQLIEFGGRLYLNWHDDPDTLSMLDLMKKAEFAGSGDEVQQHPVAS